MGGFGSGRKRSGKPCLESVAVLSVKDLWQCNVFSGAGFSVDIGGDRYCDGEYHSDEGLLLLKPETRELMMKIGIVSVERGRSKARRYLFECPCCQRRCEKLYWYEKNFKCRKCTGLRYRAEVENQQERLARLAVIGWQNVEDAAKDGQASDYQLSQMMGEVLDLENERSKIELERLLKLDAYLDKYKAKQKSK